MDEVIEKLDENRLKQTELRDRKKKAELEKNEQDKPDETGTKLSKEEKRREEKRTTTTPSSFEESVDAAVVDESWNVYVNKMKRQFVKEGKKMYLCATNET